MIRRAAASLLLVACGPSIPLDDDESTREVTTSTSVTTATSAGTTVSNEEETSTAVLDDEGLEAFIEEPDGGVVCAYPCDLWSQDCPDSQKCVSWAEGDGDEWNATRCSDLDPTPAAVGEPCVVQESPFSGLDDCEFGAFCWGVDPVTLEGTCVALCKSDFPKHVCDDGLSCYFAFDGVINLCLPSCDPLAPSCAADEVCAHSELGDPARFVCVPVPPFDPRAYGETCGAFDVCADGFACVSGSDVPGCTDPHCCTVVGDLSKMTPCPDASQTCLPFDHAKPTDELCYCGVES